MFIHQYTGHKCCEAFREQQKKLQALSERIEEMLKQLNEDHGKSGASVTHHSILQTLSVSNFCICKPNIILPVNVIHRGLSMMYRICLLMKRRRGNGIYRKGNKIFALFLSYILLYFVVLIILQIAMLTQS